MDRSPSSYSTSSRGSSSTREIQEESVIEEEEEGVERVYVAVKRELKDGKSTLLWLLQNIDRERRRVVVTHVHIPAQMIPLMGSKFPANKLEEQVVKEYRQNERVKMHKCLDDYVTVCSDLKVRAEKLVIEADDVAKGIVKLVSLHGIAKLIMGAAADKHFSRRMKVPKSKTAITVKQKADSSCKIWFVCKGQLICTREAILDISGATSSSASTLSSLSSQSEQLRSRFLPQGQAESLTSDIDPMHEFSINRSRSENNDPYERGTMSASRHASSVRTLFPRSRFSTEVGPTTGPWDRVSKSFQSVDHSFYSASDEVLSCSSSLSIPQYEGKEEESMIRHSVQESDEDLHFSSPQNELEDGLDAEVYDRLREAQTEAEYSKHEAYKESLKRQKAERNAIEAFRRAKAIENLHTKEINKRKEIEEELGREKLEVEMLKNQFDKICEQFQLENMQKLELEKCVVDSDNVVRNLEEKLLEAQHLLNTLQMDHEELGMHRDAALQEVEELRQNKELVSTSSHRSANFLEFSFSEIEEATCNFSDSLKIGEGGYGSVYKGFLRNTMVAIKMLNPQSLQGLSEFQQEVDVLSRVRHPNLVTLIGVCSETRALIYDFLSNGSLEDRLNCKGNTAPLTWQTRTRIAADICNALIFLHSSRPHPVVHGYLKLENILLDANLVSKLSDFGICRLLVPSDTCTTSSLYRQTRPKGTFENIDPEFLATGELTPLSDVYAFGVIILRLLTGKPAFGVVEEVEEALDEGFLHGMIDPAAGDWPFVQAKQLAHLGLRCCEISRKNRPDLKEVWRLFEPMIKMNSLSSSSLSFSSVIDDDIPIPNYFMCPIFQEIMRDPQIAADGFTYEAEAIKGWIDSGHNTSPMTNLTLPHCDLVPNRALRSAIHEWFHHHPQS